MRAHLAWRRVNVVAPAHRLVERLLHPAAVVRLHAPVNHKLDLPVLQRGARLGDVGQDGELVRPVVDRHHRVDGVVVPRHRLRDVVVVRVRWAAPVVRALDHLLAVRVGVPRVARLEPGRVPHDHLLAPVVRHRPPVAVTRHRRQPRRLDWDRSRGPLDLNEARIPEEPNHVGCPRREGLCHLGHEGSPAHPHGRLARRAGEEGC
mmetsp:Transcript_11476/g.37946  ORF Transcript_11476/g.37946 Transcript_11476/m.37946 type:complete len:205 (+) Transcript_11476:2611-3225(+)